MKQLMASVFSDKFVNRNAIGGNQLLLIMYRFAFPFAIVLDRLRVTPNQITGISTLLAVLAGVSLNSDLGTHWFVIFWAVSLLLDFCDGTVARMTGNLSKTALRYDHVSDLFKVFIIMLSAGWYYDSFLIWVSDMTASFSFMYYTVLNHELSSAKKNLEKLGNQPKNVNTQDLPHQSRGRFKFVTKHLKNDLLITILKNGYISLITINGHTLLVFLLIPLGSEVTMIVFLYLILLSLIGIVGRISALRKIPRKVSL